MEDKGDKKQLDQQTKVYLTFQKKGESILVEIDMNWPSRKGRRASETEGD